MTNIELLAAFLAHNQNIKDVLLFSNDPLNDSDTISISASSMVSVIDREANKKQYDLIALLDIPYDKYLNIVNKTKCDTLFLAYKELDDDTYLAMYKVARSVCKRLYFVSYKTPLIRDVLDEDFSSRHPLGLSVIFPVYNVASYLRQCLDSLSGWDYEDVEYLFIDDGSKDNSAQIIKEASKRDSRIKYIYKDNGGCASARELGLSIAKGEYVGFIDPDDFFDKSMFKKLFARAKRGNYDIAYCGYNEYYNESGKSKPIVDLINKPYDIGTYDRSAIDTLMAYLRIGIWRGIYRKKMLEEHNIHFYTDLKRFDDLPFKVETLAVANSVISINEYLYYYRLNREGQTVAIDDERLFVHFDIFKHLDEFFANRSERQKELYKVIKRDTHNWALSLINNKYRDEYLSRMKHEE